MFMLSELHKSNHAAANVLDQTIQSCLGKGEVLKGAFSCVDSLMHNLVLKQGTCLFSKLKLNTQIMALKKTSTQVQKVCIRTTIKRLKYRIKIRSATP